MKKWTIIILVLLVVGIGAVVYFTDDKLPEGDIGTTSTLLAGENAVFSPDQPPADIAHVMQLTLEEAGYVVIHEDTNGTPGEIIGVSGFLEEGGHAELDIELSRPSVDGETLYAMLHSDDGDQSFDASVDAPITDEDGNIINMSFTISEDAEIPSNIAL